MLFTNRNYCMQGQPWSACVLRVRGQVQAAHAALVSGAPTAALVLHYPSASDAVT